MIIGFDKNETENTTEPKSVDDFESDVKWQTLLVEENIVLKFLYVELINCINYVKNVNLQERLNCEQSILKYFLYCTSVTLVETL